MEFFEVLQARHSVRAYTAQAIEPGTVQAILDAANRAPSAGNKQAYEIFAVTSRDVLRALASGRAYFDVIPLALVFCAHPARAAEKFGERGARLYCVQDATIACTYAMLAATALGLSSVWIGRFDEAEVRRAIGAGEDLLPVAILPIGYAAQTPEVKPRRALEDLVRVV
ncbi:MAG: nitroreductase family protein [Anaerolineales bacterium]|nr:nitroreductase family protein [Anaerolineales bacterium]